MGAYSLLVSNLPFCEFRYPYQKEPKDMTDNYVAQGASGYGLATVAENGVVLDSWFAETTLQSVTEISETRYFSASEAQTQFQLATPDHDTMRRVRSIAIHTTIADLRQPPRNLHDLYLRLHLLSQRKMKPWQANLAGFTELLIDVAWTSHGPCLPEQLKELQKVSRNTPGRPTVYSVFRLPCMVEGRISLGATIQGGSHIGGGASIMGSTSGGGKHVVSIGANCLLGANSGVGISLGDNCAVEAGLYVTAGLPVTLADGTQVKAITLSGQSNLLFRRSATTGRVEVVDRPGEQSLLLPTLHRSGQNPTYVPEDVWQ
jgi:2,3,4,5-tetrahydropyridine-2-carboxylate N-succinyltransferase